jgi:vesicle-associated membrane protein 7
MVHNVEQILSRGERIELLVDKTDNLSGQAWAFRRGCVLGLFVLHLFYDAF